MKKNILLNILVALVTGLAIGYFVGKDFKLGSTDAIVLKVGNTSFTESVVLAPVKNQIFQAEQELFRVKERAIQDFLESKLLEEQSKKTGKSVESLLSELSSAPIPVSDEEVTEFMTSKGLNPDDPRFKKDTVKEYLKYRKQFDKRSSYLSELKKTSKFEILLKGPELPKVKVSLDGYPSTGTSTSKVSLVFFSDLQNPLSYRSYQSVKQARKMYDDKQLRIIYRELPSNSTPDSLTQAIAAQCAQNQGRFWDYIEVLFTNTTSSSVDSLVKLGETVSLNTETFKSCIDKKETLSLLEKGKTEALNAGVHNAPSFVINGELLEGPQSINEIKSAIDKALGIN